MMLDGNHMSSLNQLKILQEQHKNLIQEDPPKLQDLSC